MSKPQKPEEEIAKLEKRLLAAKTELGLRPKEPVTIPKLRTIITDLTDAQLWRFVTSRPVLKHKLRLVKAKPPGRKRRVISPVASPP